MLSDAKCRSEKPGEKQRKLSDGGGLYLLVLPSGGKSWRLGYRFGGKQKALALGQYPAISLADARTKRDNAKRMLAAGADPSMLAKSDTFESFARRWHDNEKGGWIEAHASRVWSRIERDVLPALGQRPLGDITAPDILNVLRKVEERGALDISKRLRQSIGSVFQFAIAEGKAKSNPAADIAKALKPKPKVKHFAALKTSGIPKLVADINAYHGEAQTRLSLLLTLHCMVRTNETRFAHWSEFEDLDGEALWRIPPERMKMGREHLVPLSPQVVELLREVRSLNPAGHLFPGRKVGVQSQNAMIFSLYRMGYAARLTVHGFRSMASTVLNESGFNREWVEMQLAHVDGSVRGVYNSAEWLPGRRRMLTFWSDFLEGKVKLPEG